MRGKCSSSGSMEGFGRKVWDTGGSYERREACGVVSIRKMGRSVGKGYRVLGGRKGDRPVGETVY